MQSTTVHIWKPRAGFVGHTSLSVNVMGASVRYLSFWPMAYGKGASVTDFITRKSFASSLAKNLPSDISSEGKCRPHYEIELTSPANAALNAYISKIQSSPPLYTTFGTNCSTIVARALFAGTGIKHNFRLHGWYQTPKTKLGVLCRGVWTPMMVYKYAKQLQAVEQAAEEDAA